MKRILTAFFISFIITLPAFADDLALNQYTGNFAEINAGTNLYYWGIFSSQGSSANAGIKGMGWSAALGHYFTPKFGLEAGFMQNYAEATFDNHRNSHLNVPYASTRFNLPITDRFSFIGKIGLGYAFSGGYGLVVPYTGIGFGYAATRNVDITTQYQGLVLGVVGAGLLSAGITYHF